MPVPDFSSTQFPIENLQHPVFAKAGINVSILRLDLLHPTLSGNKWFKLKYNLLAAQAAGAKNLVSFGGAWSNHLHALAWAARQSGFSSVGFVRGELPNPLNACLQDAVDWGMQLIPISRDNYRNRSDAGFVTELISEIPNSYVIPEGGANPLGIRGCSEILEGVPQELFDVVVLACGTGTTLAGLLMQSTVPLLGIQVLKGEGYLKREVEQLLLLNNIVPQTRWHIRDEFHRGGYAKADKKLLDFCLQFEAETSVPLDPVYSGKLLLALFSMAQKGECTPGTRLGVIHGGGLQGTRGYFN
jgi:1-aminocyclopropane-1-carboxylate deaminase